MMAMPAALLGFSTFKLIGKALSVQENVYLQSVAVAVGTGPLSFGLVGAIPSIELLITKQEGKYTFSTVQLMVWSFSISFIGIFIAKLLRRLIIEKQKQRFPSGAAAAALIGVLNKRRIVTNGAGEDLELRPIESNANTEEVDSLYRRNSWLLTVCFVSSSIYTILSRTFPIIRALPVFGYRAAANMWVLEPSPAYIGQGIIMGVPTTASMLLGAIIGWAILAPLASAKGWAPGKIDDWKDGGQGWIMWISLAIMIADAVVGFIFMLFAVGKDIYFAFRKSAQYEALGGPDGEPHECRDCDEEKYNQKYYVLGLASSGVVCILIVKLLFPTIPFYALIIAVAIAPILSILGIRALGETDLNPVSSIAKMTQLLFGVILRNHPHAVLISIISGAITEAGAQQSGDLMQDFKTGYLAGASSFAQLIGMAVGTCWSVVVSSVVYKVYLRVYTIPGPEFRIPTAFIWADCARLVLGEGLPPHVPQFALWFGIVFGIIAIAKQVTNSPYLPSGVAAGIGMYSVPSFTLARFIGGILAWAVKRYSSPEDVTLVIASSGLILGEGVMSVGALFWRARKEAMN